MSELKLLAATGEGKTVKEAGNKDPKWLEESIAKLRDFFLLVRLKNWVPALFKIRNMVSDIFSTSQADDPQFARLSSLLEAQDKKWDVQTLESLSELVVPVKQEIPQGFSPEQMLFLTILADSESLVLWLLNHKDTQEFNRLLEVCRPSTDEPRLISSIASLVHIRTVLMQTVYRKVKYAGLREFLTEFRDKVELEGAQSIMHLRNIQSSFEGLIDVFEKQTRSPGIKSCY